MLRALSESGDISGKKVLLPHADIGRELLADELRKQGADVTEVVAYRTIAVEADREGEPDIYRMLLERTHRRRHVHERVGGAQLRARPRRGAGGRSAGDDGRRVHRTGDRGGRGAVEHQDDDQPASYTIPALVDAIVEVFRGDETQAKSSRAKR